MWTARDIEIVETLTRRLRVLALSHIRSIWWLNAGSQSLVQRRLRRLIRGGLVQQTTINSISIEPGDSPLLRWKPGESTPDFAHIERNAIDRLGTPKSPTEVYTASRLAANLFGVSGGYRPHHENVDHDLLLAAVFVRYRHDRPAAVESRGV